MLKFFRAFYFTPQFFAIGIAAVCLLAFGFAFGFFFTIARLLLLVVAALIIADTFLLFRPGVAVTAKRKLPKVLGLGDDSKIDIRLNYHGSYELKSRIIDELPVEIQERDFDIEKILKPGINELSYSFRAITRGVYRFGNINVFLQSPLGMVRRKIVLKLERDVPVYPSIEQMHEYEMMAFSRVSAPMGSRQFRRIGQSYEFEQISPFTEGDDYRNINWKATGKIRELMVNQYQDERSQNMYCIISKGRAMKMAFNKLSLLDYAINSSLAISNVALKKYDKVGLITFSDKIGTAIRAENRKGHIQKILESLYHEKERELEPSYELLYRSIDKIARNRSLLMLFANFENRNMAMRALPILKRISKKHLLVMVLFKDDELEEKSRDTPENVEDIYKITLAKQHLSEKQEIAFLMRSQGIQTITSSPRNLSLDVINKYLELKSKGMI